MIAQTYSTVGGTVQKDIAYGSVAVYSKCYSTFTLTRELEP